MTGELALIKEEIQTLEIMAKYAHESKFFATLGGMPGIMTIMMFAKDVGLSPMQAIMGGVHNIQGKLTISPQMMNGLIRKSGHKLEIDSTSERCIIKGIRKDTGEIAVASFSVEEAKKANIFKSGGGWDKYPSDMCFARALSRLSRRLFPDVIGMAYVEGEIEDKETREEKNKDVIDVSSREVIDVPIKEEILCENESIKTEQKETTQYITENQQKMFFVRTNNFVEFRENVKKRYGEIAKIPKKDFQGLLDRIDVKEKESKNTKPEVNQEESYF